MALLSAVDQTHCVVMWFQMSDFLQRVLISHRNGVLAALFGCYMADAT